MTQETIIFHQVLDEPYFRRGTIFRDHIRAFNSDYVTFVNYYYTIPIKISEKTRTISSVRGGFQTRNSILIFMFELFNKLINYFNYIP